MPSDAADAVEPALGNVCNIVVADVARAGCFQSDVPEVLISKLVVASIVVDDNTHFIWADLQAFSEGGHNDQLTNLNAR